jgi:hypothetical protein
MASRNLRSRSDSNKVDSGICQKRIGGVPSTRPTVMLDPSAYQPKHQALLWLLGPLVEQDDMAEEIDPASFSGIMAQAARDPQ